MTSNCFVKIINALEMCEGVGSIIKLRCRPYRVLNVVFNHLSMLQILNVLELVRIRLYRA